jgi:hypothetical protein
MLVPLEPGKTAVQFCQLVEHPGGHDGGEFPAYETFRYEAEENSVVYEYNRPQCPNDTFSEEDVEVYNVCPTRQQAVARLTVELKEVDHARTQLQLLLDKVRDPNVQYHTWTDEADENYEDDDSEDSEDDD